MIRNSNLAIFNMMELQPIPQGQILQQFYDDRLINKSTF
jgi:hypothetical protein